MAGLLRLHYGVAAREITPISGGWSALAYRVNSDDAVYFLKRYEKRRSGTAALLKHSEMRMSAASWLEANTALRGRISAPLLTVDGAVLCEDHADAYLLFPFIDGITLDTAPLSLAQQLELAEIVAILHCNGQEIPFELASARDDFVVPCGQIKLALADASSAHRQLLLEFEGELVDAIERAERLAAYAAALPFKPVVCHTDIHGWNLMQADGLVLVDWENVKFAPPEADLYGFWGAHFWQCDWEAMLSVYRGFHPDYRPDEKVLAFYQLRRRLDDIDEFYREISQDDLTPEAFESAAALMRRECVMLGKDERPGE